MSGAPSGEQFSIAHGEQRATIVEVGGGVREYFHGGRAVLEPYDVRNMCDGAHGTVLAPWPNRLADGRYSFDGVEHQLALTEPGKRNAIHGLLRWSSWRALAREPNEVLMGARIAPQSGYPFDVEVTVLYALGENGLRVTTTASNNGERPCPFGVGQHPYLSPGQGTIDDCALELPAATVLQVDSERSLPAGKRPVAGSSLDFRAARKLGSAVVDSPFTDLIRDDAGLARTKLIAPDGSCVELWVDEAYAVLEIFTGDTLAPGRRRTGLAVEPMTCPPNAFASGERLLRIDPGERVQTTWGVALSDGTQGASP